MKITTLSIALLLTAVTAMAQTTTGIVKLRGTKLTYPLVNKWIDEFKKEYPGITVSIAPNAPADSIDFSIASYPIEAADLKENQALTIVTHYVQLLIVNANRPGLTELQAKGVTEKDLGELFFQPAPAFLASASHTSTLYIRDRPVCAVKAFAEHYGVDPKEIKGTGIKGDDLDLAESVKIDVNGIAFNNLGFIYDVKTRKVKEGIAIVPLDLNSNGKVDADEQIYGSLDQVIAYVEKSKSSAFINSPVNFLYNKDSQNKSAALFLNWILTKGQKFNHDLGFINPETSQLEEQKKNTTAVWGALSSQPSCEGTTSLMKDRKTKQSSNP